MFLGSLAPVQLLTQHREVTVTGRVEQADGVFGAPDAHGVFVAQIDGYLPIEMGTRIGCVNNPDLDLVAVANQDRPIGQGMRAEWHQSDGRDLRMQDRAVRGQRLDG